MRIPILPHHSPALPARLIASLCILAFAQTSLAAERAKHRNVSEDNPGRTIEIGFGSGINIGTATRFRPYLKSEWMNYIPHAYLAWSPTASWRISTAVTKVNAANWCVLCNEKVSEDYVKLALGAQRRLGSGQGVLVGAEVFIQDGKNKYEKLRQWMSDIRYEGDIRDSYTYTGIGLSAEIPLARLFSFGSRFNLYSQDYHRRDNTLIEDDIYGDGKRPYVVNDDSPGAAYSIEIFIRMGLRLGY